MSTSLNNSTTLPTLVPLQVLSSNTEPARSLIQIYDKPLCCSTGVCGPEVDPVLVQFAADLQWLKSQGQAVERYNLAQQPEAFVQNPAVQELLTAHGMNCLPLVMIDGRVLSRECYPSRDQLTQWAGSLPTLTTGCCSGPAPSTESSCCEGSHCC